MNTPLPQGATIGILGGGQLGRMLAMAAAKLGYRTVVLDPAADSPAAQVANTFIHAAYDDTAALKALLRQSDVITYEFENVPVATALSLSEEASVFPPPEALEAAQDRLAEKIFLNAAGISTAPFVSVDNDADLARGLERFSGGVLKTRRMGYDGKGQRVFRNVDPTTHQGVFSDMGSVPLILEALVPFRREISVIAARSIDGSIAIYDPAENEHRDGILHRSIVPARVGPGTLSAAKQAATEILGSLHYVGVLGVEFFVLDSGKVLVNEIAPRVHNSGHWTEAACTVSQFEQHIRAVAGLPLGDTRRHSDCLMENLIGDEVLRASELLEEPDLMLHLYGKTESRPGRKMGHFTRLTNN
ncbi:5-(carboxyamino)imidazole ribonucleotide synthase [Nitratireductor kimnyeongensis]|uniref:N5-carboxyaminoimidazole ribonucleotide synthase n=1 Tax=Nitratireductor kimnyeongensis TaxID=430679 RepID=A0ABW0TD64_9HYPH|nr:5-(carboxyamino)imidazole ribonucleotide synthase [Nitratireductor kimnyeongensis]QZZ36870.1 5-(carboxyamino)imidazole ribonucleotide synthase [Nitratireductor kimnyeongensis]